LEILEINLFYLIYGDMYETCKREVDTDPSVAAMLYTEYGDNIHTHNKKG